MSIGDFIIFQEGSVDGGRGSKLYNVAAGATMFYPGEPVVRALGGTTVTRLYTTNTTGSTKLLTTTDANTFVGIAATIPTHTASVAGTVYVTPTDSDITWLAIPNDTTAWDTQAEYDALVGKTVLIDLTGGAYTVLAADGATGYGGCVIAPLNITKHPGRVAVVFRNALSDMN